MYSNQDFQSHPSPLSASPHATTPPNNKNWQAKVKWTTTEEAALVTVLSDLKCIGNSSESSFKGTVWKMVVLCVHVGALVRATLQHITRVPFKGCYWQ